MKKLILLLLLTWIYPMASFSAIDECKTDIYFANGIMNEKEDAEESLQLVIDAIQAQFYNGDEVEMLKHHNFDTAYNESYGMTADLFEAFLQTLDQSTLSKVTWGLFKEFLGRFLKADKVVELLETMTNMAKNSDLTT